nr:hypothetical protein [Tanacetum cinerariifolium]
GEVGRRERVKLPPGRVGGGSGVDVVFAIQVAHLRVGLVAGQDGVAAGLPEGPQAEQEQQNEQAGPRPAHETSRQ